MLGMYPPCQENGIERMSSKILPATRGTAQHSIAAQDDVRTMFVAPNIGLNTSSDQKIGIPLVVLETGCESQQRPD
jgi:hypothetical protein